MPMQRESDFHGRAVVAGIHRATLSHDTLVGSGIDAEVHKINDEKAVKIYIEPERAAAVGQTQGAVRSAK